jgi:putative hydrolase of the HAD superfamily
MPHVPRYRAVLFDAGETLLAPHPSFGEIFAAVLRECGHAVDLDEVEEARHLIGANLDDLVAGAGLTTWSTSREYSRRFWRSIYAVIFDRLGIDDHDGRIFEALYHRFTRFESYRLFPDVLPTIRAIRGAGVMVGLISNFEEWLEEMLTAWEVMSLFAPVVISGREGVEKPDPAIFRLAVERAGVAAEECVYVGDHPRIDAEAAEAVGMGSILIDRRGHHPDHSGPRVASLSEILPLIGVEPLDPERSGSGA